jgi:hypothetical protein
MKPLNLDNSPCTPTSSNCVIWQGPNIPCIKLCTGDTISDVVYKLATELCTVLDTLNITAYDLTCFNLPECGPSNFQALIQFLIDRICELQNASGTTTTTTTTTTAAKSATKSPEVTNYLLTAAPCFGGGTVALIDYVDLIANRICDLINQITVINASLTNLDIRVSVLEAAPAPVFTIPTFVLGCDIGTIAPVLANGSTQQIDTVIRRFINEEWCPMKAVLGTSSALSTAITSQCIAGTDLALGAQYITPGIVMQVEYPTYVGAPTTLAQAVSNLWIALCDLRTRIALYEKTSVVAAGDNVTVSSATVANVTTYTVNALDTVVVGTDDIVVTPSAPVAGVTTYTISRPKENYYNEVNGFVNVLLDPVADPTIYHFPVGYNVLSYTNTTGATKTFTVHVSYIGVAGITNLVNSASFSNSLDGAIVTTVFAVDTVEYESVGARTRFHGSLMDGPTTGDIVDIGTAETVVTTPGALPVEFRFIEGDATKHVSFFKLVTLNNGESVSLKFKTAAPGEDAFLLQAQILVQEL